MSPRSLPPRTTTVLFAVDGLGPDVYSLNVPVPGEVGALVADLGRRLPAARARSRGEHTLVCKRLDPGDGPTGGRGGAATTRAPHDRHGYHELEARARDALAGTAPFEARTAGVDYFETAASGPSPVTYLAVESPGLVGLHDRLCSVFDPVEGIEGDDYVPHVTIARGGSVDRARDLRDADIDPVTWTVTDLVFWDAERGQSVSHVSLPA